MCTIPSLAILVFDSELWKANEWFWFDSCSIVLIRLPPYFVNSMENSSWNMSMDDGDKWDLSHAQLTLITSTSISFRWSIMCYLHIHKTHTATQHGNLTSWTHQLYSKKCRLVCSSMVQQDQSSARISADGYKSVRILAPGYFYPGTSYPCRQSSESEPLTEPDALCSQPFGLLSIIARSLTFLQSKKSMHVDGNFIFFNFIQFIFFYWKKAHYYL